MDYGQGGCPDHHADGGEAVITVVYFEADHLHALELIAKAVTFSESVYALCENGGSCVPALSAGASKAVVIGLIDDDCAQGDHIASVIGRMHADSVLFPATIRGRFLSAWVAARLQTGLTADCTGLDVTTDDLLLQIRPAFGGNLTASILCHSRKPQIASVRPGIFPIPELRWSASSAKERIDYLEPEVLGSYLKRTSFSKLENTVCLQEAKVVITGGKGIGSKKGFDKLFHLAHLLGGVVGATRGAVDAGYISYDHQIGQTGVIVHPDLYIGMGVSGCIQHTTGMNGSKTVIAVNHDRRAALFAQADFGIVSDWEEAADILIDLLERT